jgi:hypothetical protein
MSRFAAPEHFHDPDRGVQLLPFRFERRASGGYLASNIVGDFIHLSEEELHRIAELRIAPGDDLYDKAYAAHLITRENQQGQLQLLATRLRSRASFLRYPTALH